MPTQCPKCQSENPEAAKFCSECGAKLYLADKMGISQTKTLKWPKKDQLKGKTIVNRYQIIEKLGKGGMGIVYKAKDTRLDRSVALKFLSPELTKDEEAKQRFIQEAKAAAALNHPHICTIYEIDEADDRTFISMEYIKGQSLKDKLESGPLDIDEAKHMVIQIAEGLRDAHEKGIIHRDIKPANIMLTEKGQPKITDFGLAKLSLGSDLTKTSTIMGTVAYMSPEQAKGEEIDHRTDIWSLGIMLYEMLSGNRPFKGHHDQAMIYSILNKEPEPLTSLRTNIPKPIEQVMIKALSKNPVLRYQDTQEFIQDLKEPSSIEVSIPKLKKSIAVLPFTDLSPLKDQEYFCDGIAEELINSLTNVEGLNVVSKTSSFQFKGRDCDIKDLGRDLNVHSVLEGSVRKAGDKLRITVQLVNVENGYDLWSDRYDRDMQDIFAIQDEIALAIVENLKLKLLKVEKAQLVKRHTNNKDAFNLYLKGRYFWERRYKGGLQKSLECFMQAIEKDPLYALAYAGIADSFCTLGLFGWLSPNESFPKAKAAAQKALEIDDSLGQAYSSLGFVYMFYEWDWISSEKAFQKALDLTPKYATAYSWYGTLLCFMGRFEEAIEKARCAQELDPLSLVINANAGHIFYQARQYDNAIEQCSKTIEMDPNFVLAYLFLGAGYLGKKQWKKATTVFQKLVELSGNSPFALGFLGYTLGMSGEKDGAEEILAQLDKISKKHYVSSLYKAVIYLGLDKRTDALDKLEKSYSEKAPFLALIKVWSLVDSLREDPKFARLQKRMNLEYSIQKD